MSSSSMFFAFTQMAILCELGERYTARFEKIYDEIQQSDWYTLSIRVQKILPIVLAGTQKTLEINIFGSVRGSRETYKIVSYSRIEVNSF